MDHMHDRQKKLGFINVYTPNTGRARGTFWQDITAQLPPADSWVLGGDFNIGEHDSDRSDGLPKKISAHEQEGWDTLTTHFGLEDTWSSDDFLHKNSLHFSWTNNQQGDKRLMARLDRFYVGDWGRGRGGQIKILPRHTTI